MIGVEKGGKYHFRKWGRGINIIYGLKDIGTPGII
jgi:hypothetical protein